MAKNAASNEVKSDPCIDTLLRTYPWLSRAFLESIVTVRNPSTSAPATTSKSPPKPPIPFVRSPLGHGCVYTGRTAPTQPK